MTERDDPFPTRSWEAGDPSLELFGQGWSPNQETPNDVDSYQGRHRAEEG